MPSETGFDDYTDTALADHLDGDVYEPGALDEAIRRLRERNAFVRSDRVSLIVNNALRDAAEKHGNEGKAVCWDVRETVERALLSICGPVGISYAD